ncbi:GSCOCG00005065001-RA-CDS [Cotesia congregata]|nr:GSCOCG00005065001-RA-CDS [Cotesia congregata]
MLTTKFLLIKQYFSIIKQFPPETQTHFQILGASMGEYVVQTGLEVQMKLCEILDEPIIMGPILHLLGFVETDCPPSPGVYGNQGCSIPMELMPDHFMPNKYLVIGEVLFEEEKLVVVHIYCNVQ